MMERRKAQQEMVGFVIIVVLVVVVGVIFLSINLRQGSREVIRDDAELSNFLSLSAKQTTDCILTEPLYADIQDILEGCSAGASCVDERSACSVLNETYVEMIESPLNQFKPGEDRPIKFNKLMAYYQDIDNPDSINILLETIVGEDGSCVSRKAGRYVQYEYPGNLIIELEICKVSDLN